MAAAMAAAMGKKVPKSKRITKNQKGDDRCVSDVASLVDVRFRLAAPAARLYLPASTLS